MAVFDFVLLLLSFVFALALTHLLSRLGSLLLARRRVQFSALHTLVVVNAVVMVFLNWLMIWDYHTMKAWDLLAIVICFVFALSNYFFCAVAASDVPEQGLVDLEAFYWENYRLFYGLMFLSTAVAILADFLFLRVNPALAFETNLDTLPFFVPSVLAVAVSKRWAQWSAGLGLLALSIWWTFTFSSILK